MASLPRCLLLAAWLALTTVLPARGEPPPAEGQKVPPADRPASTDRDGDPLPEGAVARLGTARLQHTVPIHALAFSPDGKILASAGSSIRLWDAATGQQLRQAATHRRGVDSVAFSPDSRLLAYTGSNNKVGVVEVTTGKELFQVVHERFSHGVAFSPDGKLLASGGRDGFVRLWAVATGKQFRALDGPSFFLRFLAFSPDGNNLLAFSDGDCRLLEVSTGKELRRWKDAHEPVALSPDGKVLALGGSDFRLHLWDVVTGKELRRLDLPTERNMSPPKAARCAVFSPDGKTLAVGDMTNTVRLWEVATGKELYHSEPFRNWVTGLAFSPDGKTLAVGIWGKVHLWDAATGKDRPQVGGHSDQINRVAFAPDGKTLVSGSANETIAWEPVTGRQLRRLDQTKQKFLTLSPNGTWVLRDEDGTIRLWESATGKTLRTLEGPKLIMDPVVFSPDGKTLAAAGVEPTLRLWDVTTGKELWTHRRTEEDVVGQRPLAFTPDGKTFLSAGYDGKVRFWEVGTGKVLRQLEVPARDIVISPNGRLLVSAGDVTVSPDGMSVFTDVKPLRLWNLTGVGQLQSSVLFSGSCGCPSFSPDGRMVAAGTMNEVRLFEVASGKEMCSFKGHQSGLLSLAFSPDGRLLASSGFDLAALVWDVTSLMRDGQLPAVKLAPGELEALWERLASPNASQARVAIWKLVAAPRQAVPFLEARLRPVSPGAPQHLARLIADLDNADFAVREKAAADLEQIADRAEPALRVALAGKPGPELRQRLQRLLEGLEGPTTDPERLRAVRAVQVLEQIATPEAGQVLRPLAEGAPTARLTQEAKAAQVRLAGRPGAMP